MKMIALGCDHGGYPLMQEIKKHLDEKGLEYRDFGTFSEDSCDYPVYGELAANAVAGGECDTGILVCGTGIGISMAANKVRGIRCALCSDCFSAEMARRHNNANMMALGQRVTGVGLALKLVDTFLTTEFEGGRHARRVGLIMDIEERNREK
ncbi:MAG: ribose 5-phosphate isomerase B [Oscillospiraceae bacterium]|nr:ribose 5-phosphate isomerase B [Oscillospiraceae bacterium]